MMIPFPDAEIELTLPHRLGKIADLLPDHPAVVLPGQIVTYGELNRRANRLANAIRDSFGPASEPVTLVCDHGLSALIGIWAVLKAGKCYASLARMLDADGGRRVLGQTRPRLILCDDSRADFAASVADQSHTLWNIDAIHNENSSSPALATSEELPAVIYFTSGSTAEAKGVVRGHHVMLLNAQLEILADQIKVGERVGFIHDIAFAGSTPEVFRPLLSGATIYPLVIQESDIASLLEWLRANEINMMHFPVTLFRQLTDLMPDGYSLPHLRLISLGGEKVYGKDIQRFWHKATAPCGFRHTFSISETGLLALESFPPHSPLPDGVLSAGFPIRQKRIRLVDDDDREVLPGEVGEIVVESRYLALGYWRNPTLTQQRFRTDAADPAVRRYITGDLGRFRADGRLELVGRRDSVVKIRGFQVNLNGVESALRAISGVREAAVVAYAPRGAESAQLAAYICATEEAPRGVGTLRRELAMQLPPYMIPTFFTWMDTLPLTATGKINRRALPPPDTSRPNLDTAYCPPRTPIEMQITDIWQRVLMLEQVGVHDNFLELGGHSLHALSIISQVLAEFQVEVPLTELFAAQTVAVMALTVAACQARLLSPEALATLLDGLNEQPITPF